MNDTTSPQQYQEKLQALRHNYLQRLKKNLRDVRRLQELLTKGLAPLKDLQNMSQLTHNLVGSGATFGFPDISESAGKLQSSLKVLMAVSSLSRDATRERQDVLDHIAIFYDISRSAVQKDITTPVSGTGQKQSSRNTGKGNVIGVLSRKENVVTDEIQYLSRQGYQISYVDSLAALMSMQDLSAAIISDELSATDSKELDNLLARGATIDLDVPFMFWLAHDDYKSHLKALRLGAKRIMASTASGKELVQALQELTGAEKDEPHIFLATKDDMLVGFYEHALEQAGLKVTTLKAHKDPLRAMAGYANGLVVVDFDVPFSAGAEFIRILRQSASLSALPILFMVSPDEYKSLAQPPDHVHLLMKPFTPEQMINAIRAL